MIEKSDEFIILHNDGCNFFVSIGISGGGREDSVVLSREARAHYAMSEKGDRGTRPNAPSRKNNATQELK